MTNKFIKDPIEQSEVDFEKEPVFFSMHPSRRKKLNYDNKVNAAKNKLTHYVKIPPRDKSGAVSIFSPIAGQQQHTILTKSQLWQCADAYTNSGIVRSAIDRHIDYILGSRTKFAVELNEELTEFATEEEKDKLMKELESPEIVRLRTNIIRVNKRVQLHDRMATLLKNIFIYGRGACQIIRFPSNNVSNASTQDKPENGAISNRNEKPGTKTSGRTNQTRRTNEELGNGNQRPPTESESIEEGMTWTGRYGEPQALLPLNTQRIVDVKVHPKTGELQGLYYDYGIINKNNELIKNTDLIVGFLNDDNIYDSTLYSGLPPLWPLLNVVQANQTLDDEDLPESLKQFWAKMGFVYTGTSKASVTKRFKEQAEGGSIVFHNQKDLVAQIMDIGKDLTELVEVRRKNAEYILQCLGLPVFFMFEDSPNHATAIASLQAYKVGTLRRYRTWFRGILEKYWYDPILADHLNVTIDEVISQRIKVNAQFEDLVFDIFKDQVSALVSLHNAGVYDDEKVLKELGADDVWQRRRQIESILEQNELEQAQEIDEIADKEGEEGFNREMRKIEIRKGRAELKDNAQGKPTGFPNANKKVKVPFK